MSVSSTGQWFACIILVVKLKTTTKNKNLEMWSWIGSSRFHQEIQDLVSGNGFNAGVFYHQMESDEWDQRRAPTLKARAVYASNLLSLLPNEMTMPVTKKVDIRGSVMMPVSILGMMTGTIWSPDDIIKIWIFLRGAIVWKMLPKRIVFP